MKTIRTRILTLTLIMATLILTGCGGFFTEPTVEIVDVIQEPVTAEGYLPFYFLYADGSTSQTFMIPPGQAGSIGGDGRGIAGVDYEWDQANNRTKLTVKFTDGTKQEEPLYVYGITVSERYFDDELGEYYFILYYVDANNPDKQDEEKGVRIYLPRGIGLVPNEPVQDELTGDWTFTLQWTDEDNTSYDITIPAGRGVNNIWATTGQAGDVDQNGNDLEGKYVIWVQLDDDSEPVAYAFTPPTDPNRWYSGSTKESMEAAAEKAKLGDFFFHTGNKMIYERAIVYGQVTWAERVSLGLFSDEEVEITFNWNDGSGGKVIFYRRLGSTFLRDGAAESFPIPTREGYTFMGWYTSSDNKNYNISPFGPTTPVLPQDTTNNQKTLVLYAAWERATFTVTFDLNVDEAELGDVTMPNDIYSYEVDKNTYFVANYDEIPVPTREGYTFVGWYTKPEKDATMSPLTDLTPICSDLYLYAIWQAN